MKQTEQTKNPSKHHVVWADRVGFSKQWSKDIESCSDLFATDTYHHMVRRFKNNIVNIRDGPNLYDKIIEYENNLFNIEYQQILNEWKKNNPQEAENDSYILQKEDEIRTSLNEKLYHFIIQLLEEEKFGFYKSEYDGEYEEME